MWNRTGDRFHDERRHPLRGIVPDATDTLKAFLAAFNAYDLDTIMSFFADDCELDMHQPADQRSARCAGSM